MIRVPRAGYLWHQRVPVISRHPDGKARKKVSCTRPSSWLLPSSSWSSSPTTTAGGWTGSLESSCWSGTSCSSSWPPCTSKWSEISLINQFDINESLTDHFLNRFLCLSLFVINQRVDWLIFFFIFNCIFQFNPLWNWIWISRVPCSEQKTFTLSWEHFNKTCF